MATLLAADLYLHDKNVYNSSLVRVFTYGSPKVFAKNTATDWSTKLRVYRWAYDDSKGMGDHVPQMPSSSFEHVGKTYKIYRKFRFLKSSQYSFRSQSDQWNPSPRYKVGRHKASVYTEALNKGCK